MSLVCQTDSRIANANITWQAACNIDITDWNKANEFIVACYALSNSVNPDADFKLQWRRVGGSFADVAADTEVCWATNTDLTDASPVTVSAACLSKIDDSQENESDNLCSALNIKSGDYFEAQFGCGFGSGALDDQEYELQMVNVTDSGSAVLQTTITTAGAGTLTIDVSDSLTSEQALD